MPNLNISQPKKHIWHIKVNLVFPGSFPLSIAKALYSCSFYTKTLSTKSGYSQHISCYILSSNICILSSNISENKEFSFNIEKVRNL